MVVLMLHSGVCCWCAGGSEYVSQEGASSGGLRVCRTEAAETSAVPETLGTLTQVAIGALDYSSSCAFRTHYRTMRKALGWPEQAREKGLEASLRRRCRYQLSERLAVTGWVGRVDGGRMEVPFAIQSDGLGVSSARRSALAGGLMGGGGGGGDSDDLKLSSRQAGIELRR